MNGPKPFAVVIHPMVALGGRSDKPWDTVLHDAEEALGLARALRWDILPGPHEPKNGWNEDAMIEAEEREQIRRLSSGAHLVPEGWHLDRGGDESDDEFDVHEEAWKSPTVRRQYAESCVVKIRRLDPRTYFGKGKVSELALYIAKNPCDYIFINTTLTPSQSRNLETVFNNSVLAADAKLRRDQRRLEFDKNIPSVEIIDRNRIILEIFRLRASTPTAKLQVRMARLEYMKSRLTLGTQARLRGMLQVLHDEIGPFKETTIRHTGVDVQYHYESEPFETERKLLRVFESRLKRQMQKEERSKEAQRSGRLGVPTIGIVGYTNVGKTTLMNALTGSELKERDLLFQTLDTTLRRLRLPSGRHAVIADSIGFIQNFPNLMSASFSLTLKEFTNCDVILHVRDISHPQRMMHKDVVLRSLREAGVSEEKLESSVIEVWNKVDLLPSMDYVPPEAVPVCAKDGLGVQDLRQVIDTVVSAQIGNRRKVSFPETHLQLAIDFFKRYGVAGAMESLEMIQVEDEGENKNKNDEPKDVLMSMEAVLPPAIWKRWPVEVLQQRVAARTIAQLPGSNPVTNLPFKHPS